MINALTIDVEDYWSILGRDWLDYETTPTEAVVRCTEKVLSLIADAGHKATFFVLGEVARAYPQLLRQMVDAGHEVGVHGDMHQQVFKLSREEFAQEIERGKKAVEDVTGQAVLGHRAPAFSIMPDTAWALEVLAEQGIAYDSSIYPIAGSRYGWPGFPDEIHERTLDNGMKIVEVSLSAMRVLGKAIPSCGGGYLRHFPYWVTRWAMKQVGRSRPAVVYMHPYEVDVSPAPAPFDEKLAQAPEASQKFHAAQLRRRPTVEPKLRKLFRQFAFAPMATVIEQQLGLTLSNRVVLGQEA
jgi:polysaccharide deacetylase family protein (PEP-CTERM system associated)